MMKLKTSPAIALSTPFALLHVWFHVVLFLCLRGREGQRQLKKMSFKFEFDVSGGRFVNRQKPSWRKRMTDTKLWSFTWPNSILSVMLSFCIWERILSGIMMMKFGLMPDQMVAANLMEWWKSIGEEAKLSKMYTNHRATAITLWSKAGVQNCHIMVISGHRSQQNLLHYNTWEVFSRSLISDRSESLAVTTINIQKEVQENSILVSTATEKTTSGSRSFFNKCTFQNVQIATLVDIYCHTVFSVYSNCLFSLIDAFWLIWSYWEPKSCEDGRVWHNTRSAPIVTREYMGMVIEILQFIRAVHTGDGGYFLRSKPNQNDCHQPKVLYVKLFYVATNKL